VRSRLVVAVATCTVLACARVKDHIRVRGQLDRRTWVIRSCDGPESYRVFMTSGGADRFRRLEHELGASEDEPLILEYDGVTFHMERFPWESRDTLHVAGPMNLERGTCRAAP
jgi:hypothetical protein